VWRRGSAELSSNCQLENFALAIILTKSLSIDWSPKMANTTTLSSKFQISIPKSLRESMKWKAGQEFAFIPNGKGVLIIPVPTIDELRGIAAGANPENYRDRNDRY
jgi:AbrB family looped-hinge helix DNA binding protein